ncbi:TM1266 family iron-only hydrogenase system putative regulator [Lacrimispora sp. 210928-DFI.3.58]|uniref:TM1266 family iron-only hydrogenase system putative regulator n=1 Tax=Lacrimispora sp. 210928-DFI.3.58 TaxID=2883214 RepID=UPI0015B3AE1E|nr:TM1266 family iron-only hydrogenase system putative regulator [Lacrimispora sp. 210928-DFI.3.58]MCB7318173.1 iron-only hydrogenase system regulator [Lacrimispora sp. 210928-DFI.3.58]
MEERLAVISCIISNPESVHAVNEKFHLQSQSIIARLGVPCREYGVSVISVVMHGTQNQISSFAGDLGKVDGVKVKSVQVPAVRQ